MRVQHDPLGVLRIRSELECAPVQADLLAQAANLLLIKLGEQVQLEDALCYLRCLHQVNLEQLGLKVAFIHKVAFERFEKESSCFLNLIVFEEDLGN